MPFAAASLDLAVSALALQFVNDLPGVLAQIRTALRPDGLFLAAFVGGESLHELAEEQWGQVNRDVVRPAIVAAGRGGRVSRHGFLYTLSTRSSK